MPVCPYHQSCNGCQLWELSYSDQEAQKIAKLKELLRLKSLALDEPIQFVSLGFSGLRQRADLTVELAQNREATLNFGFYDREYKLLDIENCAQFSGELQTIYTEFRHIFSKNFRPKDLEFFQKGSLRLRVGANGEKGCWLDFSNLAIKNFLREKELLQNLQAHNFHIEIGQKGKSLSQDPLRLTEPVPRPWFKTWLSNKKEIQLNCLISDFTQASWAAAQSMVQTTLEYAEFCKKSAGQQLQMIEFGAGIGQFTLPLLSAGYQLTVYELSPSACDSLKLNSTLHHLSDNLKVYTGDFQRSVDLKLEHTLDLALVNPSRSGLRQFTEALINSGAKYLIYISCFPESLTDDLKKLSLHYKLRNIKIIDQFPQTKHFECAVFLEKLN